MLWAKSSILPTLPVRDVYAGVKQKCLAPTAPSLVSVCTAKPWCQERGTLLSQSFPVFFSSSPLSWVKGGNTDTSFILNISQVMQIWSVTKLSFLLPADGFAQSASVQRDLQRRTKAGTRAHVKLLSPSGLWVHRTRTALSW